MSKKINCYLRNEIFDNFRFWGRIAVEKRQSEIKMNNVLKNSPRRKNFLLDRSIKSKKKLLKKP
ncbi:hypothetical protein DLM75_16830 [Leptospira stimsonii]|uniref:Uncharacterized protein n=1 Tax=Leptospira stimsonii TaxID=2202203 RepID=A0A396Z0H9_9LEPT|nr:hypothetical protein DLM75_16830 [Leptospira stimsonii]